MKQINRDNTVIDYQMTGKGDITLLFVHGAAINQEYWSSQINYFAPKYNVVTFDLPGHGKSGKERVHWSLKGFADDVTFVIRELNLENVILIGHSMGGDINLIAATSNAANIIGFIGIDNFKNAVIPLPEEYQKQADSILQKLQTDFAITNEQYAKQFLITPQTPATVSQRVLTDYRKANERLGVETAPEIFNIYKLEKELLPKLKFKMYLINVDYTPIHEEPLKQYAGKGYEVMHMKGTSHFPMIENPDELNKLLQQAINKISKVDD